MQYCIYLYFVTYILLLAAAHCFRSPPSQLTHKHTNKTLQGGRASSASRLDSNLFEEGERGEFEQKDEMDIVSLTLRACLGLSFQGIYIYLPHPPPH